MQLYISLGRSYAIATISWVGVIIWAFIMCEGAILRGNVVGYGHHMRQCHGPGPSHVAISCGMTITLSFMGQGGILCGNIMGLGRGSGPSCRAMAWGYCVHQWHGLGPSYATTSCARAILSSYIMGQGHLFQLCHDLGRHHLRQCHGLGPSL